MSSFYDHALQGHEPPVAALAAAMRENNRKYHDPAFWGAFEISVASGAMANSGVH
jgi:CHAT domain-containing protein